LDELIFEDMPVLRNVSLPDDFIEGVVLHPGDKKDTLGGPLSKQGVIIIGSVIDDDGSRVKLQTLSDFYIRPFSLGDPGKRRQVAIMVQQKVQFDSPFGTPKFRPVKESHRKIDDGRIQAEQLILEPKLLLSDKLLGTSLMELEKDPWVKFPRAMFIGIGQGGMSRSCDPQMFQFSLAASQTPGDFSQRVGSSQLAEKHGHKLPPAGETSGMAFSFGFFHDLMKFNPRKQL